MAALLRPLPVSFFRRRADAVAPDLLGRYLVRRVGRRRAGVLRIVETEAYLGVGDRASHAWNGRQTRRNASLFRAGGCAYVYLIYGIHHCLNAVTGADGDGSAVLIRAAEGVESEGWMLANRGLEAARPPRLLAGGPGRLCQAMAIGLELDGARLDRGPLSITRGRPAAAAEIARGPRIGVAYAGEAATWPLRFALAGHPSLSRPI